MGLFELHKDNATVTPESSFLLRFFDVLNSAGIQYAVMRNYATLPWSSGGSDLDILIRPNEIQRCADIIGEVVRATGGVVAGAISIPHFTKLSILGKRQENEGFWGLTIDLFGGLYFKGGSRLLAWESTMRKEYRGISVLPDDLAAVVGVLKELLHNGVIPERYRTAATMGISSNREALSQALSPIGPKAFEMLCELLHLPSGFPQEAASVRRLRSSVFLHGLRTKPFELIIGRVLFESSKVKRLLAPTGIVVAFLGTDGAGKSTIIQEVKPVLDEVTHNTTQVLHLRPGLFPPLSQLAGKKNTDTAAENPHKLPPSGLMVSMLRLAYLLIDYILGYWLVVRPKISKQPTVVIFDRYAFDIVLDQLRFRIRLPDWAVSSLIKLVPKPNLVFGLYAPPEIIFARKAETSLEETRRQVDELKRLCGQLRMSKLISTEGPVESTVQEVLNTLIKYYRMRGG